MGKSMSLSQAEIHLAKMLSDVEKHRGVVTITRSGKPVAVLLSVEDYEGLLETSEILADEELSEAVGEGLRDAEAGRVVSHEKFWSGAGE